MPSLPIGRGRPGPGFLAHVLVSKYADHLPLYRQSQIYAREGVDLDRSTMADWVGKSTALLEPLAEAIAKRAKAGAALFADGTLLKMLAPGNKKTKTARIWAMSGMSGHGQANRRPAFGISSQWIEKASILLAISRAIKAGCMRMAMPDLTAPLVMERRRSGLHGPYQAQVRWRRAGQRFRHCRRSHQTDCTIVWR